MNVVGWLSVGAAALSGAALLGLRIKDGVDERALHERLLKLQPANPGRFDASLVAALPEPARRYFAFSIAPGTPLLPVAEITMRGEFSLGTRAAPNFRRMEAHQVLAAPHGFLWRLALPGGVPISGSDAGWDTGSWTRFRILGLVPVARQGGDPDHLRAAFGRYIAEAAFWTPAALLPGPAVAWEELGPDQVRVTVRAGALSQAVDLVLAADGQPLSASFQRWSNANADKRYQLQPFGGTLSDFQTVDGYRLPFRVEAGNHFGTPEYFAFYKARVVSVRFPQAPQ